jgi:hypothetical protein
VGEGGDGDSSRINMGSIALWMLCFLSIENPELGRQQLPITLWIYRSTWEENDHGK